MSKRNTPFIHTLRRVVCAVVLLGALPAVSAQAADAASAPTASAPSAAMSASGPAAAVAVVEPVAVGRQAAAEHADGDRPEPMVRLVITQEDGVEVLPPPAAKPVAPVVSPAAGPQPVEVGNAPLVRGGTPIEPAMQATAAGAAGTGARGLPAEIVQELRRRGVPAGDVSLYVQAIDAASPLVSMNAERSVALASTTKLLTTMAALDKLGPAYRWQTQALLSGKLVGDELRGDLVLVGGGDPSLDAAALIEWFTQLRKRGLRRIAGNIVLDRSAFNLDDRDHDSTPEPTPSNPHHAWPDAFLVNEGHLTLWIESDASGAPSFSADLLPQGVTVESRLQKLAASRSCASVRRPPTVEVVRDEAGVRLRVQGEWARDCERRRFEVLALPSSEHTSRSIHAAWLRVGGELQGAVVERVAPARTAKAAKPLKPWHVWSSPPLSDVLLEVNKWSNNVMARQIFLALSPKFPQRPATLDDARQVFREWLATQGLSPTDASSIAVDNGSGLSRDERGAARVMAELLLRAWGRPEAKPMLASMPLVGRDGTMAHRLNGSRVEGHALIKTGTLRDVRAIAGYVKAQSGAVYAVFSTIQNQHPGGQAVLDRVIEWVYANH